jgi:hypothetical protein
MVKWLPFPRGSASTWAGCVGAFPLASSSAATSKAPTPSAACVGSRERQPLLLRRVRHRQQHLRAGLHPRRRAARPTPRVARGCATAPRGNSCPTGTACRTWLPDGPSGQLLLVCRPNGNLPPGAACNSRRPVPERPVPRRRRRGLLHPLLHQRRLPHGHALHPRGHHPQRHPAEPLPAVIAPRLARSPKRNTPRAAPEGHRTRGARRHLSPRRTGS